MNEVVDAKIVKVVYIESCKECPYTTTVRGLFGNYLECVKIKQCIHDETRFLLRCPLDQATCVITEEVQE